MLRLSLASGIIVLSITSSALAGIFFTSPTASTAFAAGYPATIQWVEDNVAPLLSDFGLAKASIYAGNCTEQTSLQLISASVNVSHPLFLTFTPEASIGPNGASYFIRFESLHLRDLNDSAIPALAFSHVFSLDGMTGSFNTQVQSENADRSTASIPDDWTAPASVFTSTSTVTVARMASAEVKAATTTTTAMATALGALASASPTDSTSEHARPFPLPGSSVALPISRPHEVGIALVVLATVMGMGPLLSGS